jgi:hypothetical protein
MKKLRAAATVVGVLTALAGPADAEISTTGTFGYWKTFAGVADSGKPICGMNTRWDIGNNVSADFFLKYFGNDILVVQITRDGWKVPYREPVAVWIQIDQAPAIKVVALGVPGQPGQNWSTLEFHIASTDVFKVTGKNAITEFANLLSYGRQIAISFPLGSEPTWVGSLTGARAAMQSFGACGMTVDAARGAPSEAGTTQTEPFSPRRAAPTPTPADTQPFKKL